MARRSPSKKIEKPSVGGSLHLTILICCALAIVTFAVYFPVRHFEFINYDDPDYVSQNPIVQQGVTWPGVKWAFTQSYAFNWHPVTWLSHMLDCQMFGLKAGAHHLVSVVIHVLNTLLLFLLFRKMTSALWPSALVAAVFALHPLHVESVAWVCERKDVLSTLFWLLTTLFYVKACQVSGVRRQVNYVLALFFFALGLMSKPMLVTLPFTLLLLDFWPLHRVSGARCQVSGATTHAARNLTALIVEKVPFFALAIGSSVVTFLVQRHEGAVADTQTFSMGLRVGNALISYLRYLAKTFWPNDLMIFYLYPETWPMGKVVGAAAVLLLLTAAVIWRMRRFPFLFTGWFWFLGTLVPVIGLVQVGLQSMADRYMYVPMIGLSVVAAWGFSEVVKTTSHFRKVVLGTAFVAVTVGCLAATHFQIRHWKNSVTIFEHAIAIVPNHVMARVMAGNACNDRGEVEKALFHYGEALKISPNFAEVYFNVGNILLGQKQVDEAMAHYERALQLRPEYVDAHANLAYIFSMQGNTKEALAHEEAALRLRPDDPTLLRNISVDLITVKRLDEAQRHLQRAIELKPDEAVVYKLLGDVFVAQRQINEAKAQYEKALQLQPDFPDARRALDSISRR